MSSAPFLKLKPKIKIFLILRNFGSVGRCFNEHVILFYFFRPFENQNQWNVSRKTCVHKNTPLVLFNAKQQVLQVLQFEK